MKIRLVFAGVALLGMMAGCRSMPWETAANSKFGFDKFARLGRRSASDDAEPAVSGNRNDDSSQDITLVADSREGRERTKDMSAISGYLQRGRMAEAAGRWNQAKMFYQRVLNVEPGNPLAHHRLAIIADKQNNFQKAEEHYLTALRTNGDDPNLLSDLGYSFLLQNRQEESEVYLRRALRANPSHARAINNMGLLYSHRGDYDGALAMLRRTGPEQQAVEKMRELFPNGRPLRNPAQRERSQSFVNSPAVKNGLAPVEFQQQRTPATNTATPINSYPRRSFDSNRGFRTEGGPLFAPSPRRPRDFSGTNGGITRPPVVVPPGSAVPLDAASQSRRTMSQSLPEIFSRSKTSAPGDRRVSPPPYPDSRNTEPFDRRQQSIDPLKAVPEWPPQHGTQIEHRPGHTYSQFSAAARNIAPPPRGGVIQPTAYQSSPVAARGFETNSLFQPSENSTGRRQIRVGSQPNDRRKAALLGLNAGADGIFPVIPSNNDGLSQARPEINQQTARPNAVQPQKSAPPLPPNFQGRLFPANPQTFPPSQIRAADRVPEPKAWPPANSGTSSYRTAARPLSQPARMSHSYSQLRRTGVDAGNAYRPPVQNQQFQPQQYPGQTAASRTEFRPPAREQIHPRTDYRQFSGYTPPQSDYRQVQPVSGQRQSRFDPSVVYPGENPTY